MEPTSSHTNCLKMRRLSPRTPARRTLPEFGCTLHAVFDVVLLKLIGRAHCIYSTFTQALQEFIHIDEPVAKLINKVSFNTLLCLRLTKLNLPIIVTT